MDVKEKIAAHRRVASAGRCGRVEERFRLAVQDGKYYEAHQTLNTLYQRYLVQEREEAAWNFAREGATLLLSKDQWESGTEVALTAVNLLKDKLKPITPSIIADLETVFRSYRFFRDEDYVPHSRTDNLRTCPRVLSLGRGDRSRLKVMQANREMFIKAAIKWSSMVDGSLPQGHPNLHHLQAVAYFEEGLLEKARHHFLYSKRTEEFGITILELAETRGHPSEAELFILQAVLQLLVMKDKEAAYSLFFIYCSQHTKFKSSMPPPIDHAPLLNFTWFLILSIDIGDPEVFYFLWKWYHVALQRDELFYTYLNKIAEIYFGKMAEVKPQGGLMGLLSGEGMQNLFSSLGSMFSGNQMPPEMPPEMAQEMVHHSVPPQLNSLDLD